MENVTLNNGLVMPLVGYGVFRVPEGDDLAEAVKTAIKRAIVVLILRKYIAMKKVLDEEFAQQSRKAW